MKASILDINYITSLYIYRKDEYVSRGARYIFRGDHAKDIVNTFSDDLEPESIAIGADDSRAYITLHVSRLGLKKCMLISKIFFKKHSG